MASMVTTKMSRPAAARQQRLESYPGEGAPPADKARELLFEDHVGTYALRTPVIGGALGGAFKQGSEQRPELWGGAWVPWRKRTASKGNNLESFFHPPERPNAA